MSVPFGVSNRVRQGGILPRVLFILFRDELSLILNACKTGCFIGFTLINPFMCADDLVVFRPISAGVQKLL